jgi:pilus assembly protein CpaB
MTKPNTVLVVSILVGLLAFALTHQYFRARLSDLSQERAKLYSGVRTVKVIAAKKSIPAGTTLTWDLLSEKAAYARDVSRDNILLEDLNQILNKKLLFSLERTDNLLWSYVDVPFRPGSGLSAAVPTRLRAVSISVSGAAAVSGLVQPSDKVDVVGTFYFPSKTNPAETEAVTLTLLQDVTVLATGQTLARPGAEAAGRGRAAGGYSTVTLEVTPREAELLIFCETMRGRLTLTLRNPSDVSFEEKIPEVNFQQVETSLPELNRYRQSEIRHKSRVQ